MPKAEAYNVVYPVLTGGVAIRIKITIGCTAISVVVAAKFIFTPPTIIAARINSNPNFRDLIVCGRACFGPAEGARFGGTTDVELVIVSGVWLETGSFDLKFYEFRILGF